MALEAKRAAFNVTQAANMVAWADLWDGLGLGATVICVPNVSQFRGVAASVISAVDGSSPAFRNVPTLQHNRIILTAGKATSIDTVSWAFPGRSPGGPEANVWAPFFFVTNDAGELT